MWGVELMRLASRVAINRIVAGVHFPVDAVAGMALGLTLGQYFVNRCQLAPGANGSYTAWRFDGTQFVIAPGGLDGDFHWGDLFNPMAGNPWLQPVYFKPVLTGAGGIAAQPLAASAILNFIWTQAVTEWRQ